MRIATFNVNGIGSRLPAVLQWLADTRPDIVGLQELKTADDRFPHAAFATAGYEALWHGQKGFNGVALLARGQRFEQVRVGLPGDPDDTHSRYLEARIGPSTMASIYAPNGNPQPGPKFEYKLAWLERLVAHAASLCAQPEPVILAGDYNIVPTNGGCDIHSAARWLDDALLHPRSRAAFRALLAQGWVDAIHALRPYEPVYTFWKYTRGQLERNAGLRIDHLLLNPPAAARLRWAGVDLDVRRGGRPSDHAPAWIELRDDA